MASSCRIIEEYKYISNMSFKIHTTSLSNINGYENITNSFKQIQIFAIFLEIGVQRSMVLRAQVSNCHLI